MATKPRTPWDSIRSGLAPAAGLLIVAFFAGYAIFGANGVIAWTDYARRLNAKQAELAAAQKQRAVVANRVRLLDPKRADPDYVDELAHKNLGVVASDEVIVPLD